MGSAIDGLCSWRRIGILILLVTIVSLIQIFVLENSSTVPGIGLEQEVLMIQTAEYRGAIWKRNVARWLAQCDSSALVPIVEKLHSESCENNCGGNGVCNRELQTCRCFQGYAGKSCQEYQLLECNNSPVEGLPFGNWRVSICSGFCDKRRSMCFCGEGTKYPYRPLAESCGFKISQKSVDWGKPDFETVLANESSKLGWCNVDPADFYSKKVQIKEECHCKYDCTWGVLCETPIECSCVNQCSGNGICRGGFCQCDESWFGIDCSIPSVHAPISSWPNWLRPATLQIGQGENKVTVARKRPLIYIYDLPPEFNSQLLEGRHYRFECVNRVYVGDNATFWSEQLEGSEIALLESLLASPHRTMNGDEADYFYVPVLTSCAITRADDAPHLDMAKYMGLRGYFSGDLNRKAYMHIRDNYPFWNRSSGRDHVWLFNWDEGGCAAPKEVWNSTMLVHWGNMNTKHKKSTTAYFADTWDPIPAEWRGDHPCYDPSKDIVLPAWKRPDVKAISEKFWARPREERNIFFYFNGNLGNAYNDGRPEEKYSMGIRQRVASEFGSSPNKTGKLGKQAAKDVIVTSTRSPDYAGELSHSRFCGVFPGDGWSGRMEDAVLHGCIPVIIQDGIHLPYENFLDYESFAVRFAEDDIPDMIKTLRNISDAEVDAKLGAVRGLWERFTYRNSFVLEAQRQKNDWNHEPDWAQAYGTLEGDDVFSTLLQILHFKLYNDPWRKQQGHRNVGIHP